MLFNEQDHPDVGTDYADEQNKLGDAGVGAGYHVILFVTFLQIVQEVLHNGCECF